MGNDKKLLEKIEKPIDKPKKSSIIRDVNDNKTTTRRQHARKEDKNMMIQEFEQLTGIYPSAQLYSVIESAYAEFDGDKVAFCKAYKENANGIASKIQHEATVADAKAFIEHDAQIKKMQEEIENLKKQVEREQEWKPCVDTNNFPQDRYDKLKASGSVMTDDEAKDLICDEFGFAREKIKLYHSIPAYEVNRHRQLREVGQIERLPLYDATDWNYIRFDCAGWSYEMINGQLVPFVH